MKVLIKKANKIFELLRFGRTGDFKFRKENNFSNIYFKMEIVKSDFLK